MKSKLFFCFLFCSIFIHLNAQEQLLGAKDLLASISETYKTTIKDFEVQVTWTQEKDVQTGTLWFKNPQKLRIDFTEPKGQVLCTNGYEFWVYVDSMNVTLHQDILAKEKEKDENGKLVVKEQNVLLEAVGFDRFLKDYAIEYQDAKTLQEYTDKNGNVTSVYKFKLIRWRSSQNGFNMIYLTVEPNGLIRKVEGITAAYKKIIFELDDYKVNPGIADLKFEYDPPAHANTVNNFISNQGD